LMVTIMRLLTQDQVTLAVIFISITMDLIVPLTLHNHQL
jgi:hypothetical protein